MTTATREPVRYHAVPQAQIDKAQGKAAKAMAKKGGRRVDETLI